MLRRMANIALNYKASPTGVLFHQSDAFVKGIMGPFGSGKSVAVCWEIFMRMRKQAPDRNGKRRTRWIIARNTFNELETTTMETWRDWFPEAVFGNISRKPPYRQKIQYEDIEAEVIFLALDKPEDQKKLLSFEVTGVWFNEARQVPFELISAALGRVGRFPANKDRPENHGDAPWPTWSGILLDTNPPDDTHWYYKAAEENSWAMGENREPVDPTSVPIRQRWQFFRQPSGLSPDAENIENLPGKREYYQRMLAGNTKEWVDVHVHGNYGFIKHGTPVYEGYWNPDLMVAQNPIPIPPGGLVYVGIDSSGRNPAAVFAMRSSLGQWQVLHELCFEGIGAVDYSRLLKQEMESVFPNHDFDIWGDPAGEWGAMTDDRTYFDILQAQGIQVRASPGLRVPERLETVKAVLGRMVGGRPGVIVSPSCSMLVRGFNGGYQYKTVSSATPSDAKPDKRSRYADVHDALQYLLCGAGEMQRVLGRKSSYAGPVQADTSFGVF